MNCPHQQSGICKKCYREKVDAQYESVRLLAGANHYSNCECQLCERNRLYGQNLRDVNVQDLCRR